MVQMAAGKTPVDAAVDSASELRIPLLTSSLTTAAAFLPIFLAESSTGEYTAPLFKVVTITLLCSWALSLTMTPMFCVYFLKVKRATDGIPDNRWYRGYRRVLVKALRRPVVTIVLVLVIFVGALQLFRFVPNIFFPSNDKPIFTAEFTLPVGTPIERTRRGGGGDRGVCALGIHGGRKRRGHRQLVHLHRLGGAALRAVVQPGALQAGVRDDGHQLHLGAGHARNYRADARVLFRALPRHGAQGAAPAAGLAGERTG